MRIAILGFGREGQAVIDYLKKSLPAACLPVGMGRQGRKYKKAEIWILDQNPKLKLPDTFKRIAVKTRVGRNYLKNLDKFDIIFRSPGVPYNLHEIQRAVKKGVKFSSATKLFFDNFKGKIIGITGTKGKGTTSTLFYKILKACGKKVYLAGNIGTPMLKILEKSRRNSVTILELSSFQLQDLKKSPWMAVVLEVFPDHLDAHKNFSEYVNAKANIAKHQKKTDKIFYFSDNKWARWIAQKSRAKKMPISARNFKLFNPQELKIPGFHNFKNAVMAANIALVLGCPKGKIVEVAKGFRGNEHRLELFRKLKGVSFYNDSASTNPQTTAAAVKAFGQPKILIVGGKDKNLDYSPLAQALKNSQTKLIVLCGENKNKIKKAILKSGIPLKPAPNLESAVVQAYRKALSVRQANPVVILSPGATSFDMFHNYAERGSEFKKIVKRLR